MVSNDHLKRMQVAQIKLTASFGRRIQRELGDVVAKLYRTGQTYFEMSDSLKIQETYGLSRDIARKALSYAVRGFEGFFGEQSYVGLIDGAELEELTKKHAEQNGKNALTEKRGIHAYSPEERLKIGIEGLKGMTVEERLKGQVRSAAIRGLVHWSDSEMEDLLILSQGRTYSGRNTKIARMLNDKYHDGKPVRDRLTVWNALYRNRTKKNVGQKSDEE